MCTACPRFPRPVCREAHSVPMSSFGPRAPQIGRGLARTPNAYARGPGVMCAASVAGAKCNGARGPAQGRRSTSAAAVPAKSTPSPSMSRRPHAKSSSCQSPSCPSIPASTRFGGWQAAAMAGGQSAGAAGAACAWENSPHPAAVCAPRCPRVAPMARLLSAARGGCTMCHAGGLCWRMRLERFLIARGDACSASC